MMAANKRTSVWTHRLLAALVIGAIVVPVADAAYVILPNGTRIDGTQIRAKSTGEIILTTAQGQQSFFKGQYTKAVADKPAEYDRALQLAGQKQFDEALKLLQGIVSQYAFLEYDNIARAKIAEIQTAKGDAVAAVAAYDDLFRADPTLKNDANLAWAWRESMLSAKQFDKLLPQLDEIIAKGERADAARAQIMRGDVRLGQNQVENAVLDYLRTVVLFEGVDAIQPEALYKAAQALKTLRDPRADQMINTLKSKYPDNEFAKKIGG